MTKKRKTKTNSRNKYNNPHYLYTSKKVTTEDINKVAYSVFGSLYYSPKVD